jgi:hypothetical protein
MRCYFAWNVYDHDRRIRKEMELVAACFKAPSLWYRIVSLSAHLGRCCSQQRRTVSPAGSHTAPLESSKVRKENGGFLLSLNIQWRFLNSLLYIDTNGGMHESGNGVFLDTILHVHWKDWGKPRCQRKSTPTFTPLFCIHSISAWASLSLTFKVKYKL